MEIRSNFEPPRRPYPQADITRPNRDTIERQTPEPATGEDVRANAARQKHEARELAKRIKNARQKMKADDPGYSKRAHAARVKHEEAEKANRIRMARERAVNQEDAAPRADSVEIAGTPVDISQRAHNARAKYEAAESRHRYEAAEVRARASAARDKLSLSDTTLRLQADAASSEGSGEESRIAELRRRVENASLNTDELIAKAAYKLLSGD